MVVLSLELYWSLKAVHSLAITRILRHLKRAAVPPPSAPARARQATCAWVASAHDVARGLVGDVRAAEGCLLRT